MKEQNKSYPHDNSGIILIFPLLSLILYSCAPFQIKKVVSVPPINISLDISNSYSQIDIGPEQTNIFTTIINSVGKAIWTNGFDRVT